MASCVPGKPDQSTLASLGLSSVALCLSQDQNDSIGIGTSMPPQSQPHSEPLLLHLHQPTKFQTTISEHLVASTPPGCRHEAKKCGYAGYS